MGTVLLQLNHIGLGWTYSTSEQQIFESAFELIQSDSQMVLQAIPQNFMKVEWHTI